MLQFTSQPRFISETNCREKSLYYGGAVTLSVAMAVASNIIGTLIYNQAYPHKIYAVNTAVKVGAIGAVITSGIFCALPHFIELLKQSVYEDVGRSQGIWAASVLMGAGTQLSQLIGYSICDGAGLLNAGENNVTRVSEIAAIGSGILLSGVVLLTFIIKPIMNNLRAIEPVSREISDDNYATKPQDIIYSVLLLGFYGLLVSTVSSLVGIGIYNSMHNDDSCSLPVAVKMGSLGGAIIGATIGSLPRSSAFFKEVIVDQRGNWHGSRAIFFIAMVVPVFGGLIGHAILEETQPLTTRIGVRRTAEIEAAGGAILIMIFVVIKEILKLCAAASEGRAGARSDAFVEPFIAPSLDDHSPLLPGFSA